MENKKNKALDLVLLCLVFLAVLYISLSKVDSAKVSDKIQDQGNASSHLARLKTNKIRELSAALEAKNIELEAVKKELMELKSGQLAPAVESKIIDTPAN